MKSLGGWVLFPSYFWRTFISEGLENFSLLKNYTFDRRCRIFFIPWNYTQPTHSLLGPISGTFFRLNFFPALSHSFRLVIGIFFVFVSVFLDPPHFLENLDPPHPHPIFWKIWPPPPTPIFLVIFWLVFLYSRGWLWVLVVRIAVAILKFN